MIAFACGISNSFCFFPEEAAAAAACAEALPPDTWEIYFFIQCQEQDQELEPHFSLEKEFAKMDENNDGDISPSEFDESLRF